MIYIDPPYNTGHDFLYNDKFQMEKEDYEAQTELFDEEGRKQYAENSDSNPRFHSDWCSMIYPRLLLARNLLTDDGVIFISIDDNELASLKQICDEIFGTDNFVGLISRSTGTTTGQDANKLGSSLDYCLVYARSASFILKGIPLDEKDIKRFNRKDEKGQFSILQLRKTGKADKKEDREGMFYAISAPDGSTVYPFGPSNYLSRWRVAKSTYYELLENNMIVWEKNKQFSPKKIDNYSNSPWTPYVKYYLEGRTKQISNLFQDIDGNKKGSIELRNLFGITNIFTNPKPLNFLIRLLQVSTDSTSIILDFFSGSATTAHAVMQLNAEDGGHRKFIMVQLPEACDEKSEAYKAGYRTICDIGKERIRRAGEKIRKEHPEAKLDTGFRVFRVDSTNMEDVFYSAGEYTQESLAGMVSHVKPDRTALDLLFSCILDLGLTLDRPCTVEEIVGYAVHNYDDGTLLACFADSLSEELLRAMAKRQPKWAVFRESSFPDSPAKINAMEIFKMYSPDTTIRVL